jgi:hypothetical protein
MEFLMKHYNVLDDDTKNKLTIERMKLENQKLKAEISRLTGERQELEDMSEIEGDIYV